MNIKNKKRFLISTSISVILLIAIIAGMITIIKNIKENSKEVSNNPEKIQNKENVMDKENVTNEENIINVDVTKNKKVDYLANAKGTLYKKNEKNIKIPVIIYHAFRTPEPKEDIYKVFCTQARFEENITTLLNEGYTFITLEDLYKYNKGEIALPEKVCIITMDDGQIGCYTEAFPILKKYNVPATIFVVNDLVGTSDYFSWEQGKEMYDSGLVKLHIHGKSHIEYSSVGKEKLVTDYITAHAELEEKMGEKIQKIMAYPAGKSSENSIKWLKDVGFEVQVQTKYGTVNKSNTLDLTGIGRIRGERATGAQILSTIKNANV